MTTFKTVVRRKRADGFYPVYIRVVHRTKMGYISTGKIVTDKQLLKSGDIKDPVVNEYCSRQILRFSEIMNKKDFTNFSVSDLIDYLLHSDEDVCFSEYASQFIARMEREGHERNAKNYRLAVGHLERFIGTTQIMFGHLTTAVLKKWLESLSQTNRAKEMYPTCWKSHSTLTLLATQDLPTFLYYMIDPLKSWCWGAILFYPFKNSRFS